MTSQNPTQPVGWQSIGSQLGVNRTAPTLCDHCGDCYELLTDVPVLNTLSNLLGGTWTLWVCAGCGHVEWFRRKSLLPDP